MADALIITTSIAVLLFVGVICSWIGNKIKIPDVLLLILAGMLIGHYKERTILEYPELFLSSLAILALAMIVFDSTARLRLKEFDTFSLKAARLTFVFTIFILALFTISVKYILNAPFWQSLLFSATMVGTSPEVVLSFKGKSRALTLLKLESIFNTPLTVIIPFLVLELMQNVKGIFFVQIIEQAVPFLMQFIVGIGTGVFVGIILFKVVQRTYTEVYSPLAVIIAALLSYVLAENLGGSGVIAVTALGLFFGNAYVKEKITLLKAESVLAKALYIMVFILTGVVIKIPYTKEFFITSGILFAAYTIVRFLAVLTSVRGERYSFNEKIYMAVSAPKGIATASVIFMLALQPIEGIQTILNMTFAFILYSLVLASIATWLSSFSNENNHSRH